MRWLTMISFGEGSEWAEIVGCETLYTGVLTGHKKYIYQGATGEKKSIPCISQLSRHYDEALLQSLTVSTCVFLVFYAFRCFISFCI